LWSADRLRPGELEFISGVHDGHTRDKLVVGGELVVSQQRRRAILIRPIVGSSMLMHYQIAETADFGSHNVPFAARLSSGARQQDPW